jgi:transposase-like protein
MKFDFKLIIAFIFCFQTGFSQENQDAAILKILLSKYYQNEKVIVKNRLQYLSLYCNKAPNNEETLEVIGKSPLLKQNSSEIKKQINNQLNEDWLKEYSIIFNNQNQYLKTKVNACLSFDEFHKVSKRFNDNNQRLMIVSKPMFFAQKYCLVKVAFYRNIEHNSGSFFLFENINGVWTVKETLNEWET